MGREDQRLGTWVVEPFMFCLTIQTLLKEKRAAKLEEDEAAADA